MTPPPEDVNSSEEARQKAERHRQQISDTIDDLSERISEKVQTAQAQLNKPANAVREYPLAAVAASVVVGFLLARATRGKKAAEAGRSRLVDELAWAYYQGRRDEQEKKPLRHLDDWQGAKAAGPSGGTRSGLFSVRSPLLDLAFPFLKQVSGAMADVLVSKRKRG